jgi:hypothetical protein
MGLPLHCTCSHDSQAAEDNNLICSGEPGKKPGLFCLHLPIHLFDKGKPAERRGRKAMGLLLHCKCSHDSQAAENNTFGLHVCLSAFISEENNDAQHTSQTNCTKYLPSSRNIRFTFL